MFDIIYILDNMAISYKIDDGTISLINKKDKDRIFNFIDGVLLASDESDKVWIRKLYIEAGSL